jgi:hypothetical protein
MLQKRRVSGSFPVPFVQRRGCVGSYGHWDQAEAEERGEDGEDTARGRWAKEGRRGSCIRRKIQSPAPTLPGSGRHAEQERLR